MPAWTFLQVFFYSRPMKDDTESTLLAPDKRRLWRAAEPFVWSFIHSDPQEDPARSIMRTLWDQLRWLQTYHLYDERGSELFEEICELPEYYLTRTENSILEREAGRIIAATHVQCILELGAGSAKKTTHLLRAQMEQRGSGIFAPVDVSLSALLVSRDAVQRDLPGIDFLGLHARYQAALSSINRDLPKLFVFLGSTIGNFHPSAFTRFFARLSAAMGADDFLLLGADCIKDTALLESAYNDAQGLTAEFILNAFTNINRLLGSNFDRRRMRYYSWYNPDWRQIEMYAVSTETQTIRFPAFATSFCWEKGERILVEISRKFAPQRLQEQLSFFDLLPVNHFTDPEQQFSLLLFRKKAPPDWESHGNSP